MVSSSLLCAPLYHCCVLPLQSLKPEGDSPSEQSPLCPWLRFRLLSCLLLPLRVPKAAAFEPCH